MFLICCSQFRASSVSRCSLEKPCWNLVRGHSSKMCWMVSFSAPHSQEGFSQYCFILGIFFSTQKVCSIELPVLYAFCMIRTGYLCGNVSVGQPHHCSLLPSFNDIIYAYDTLTSCMEWQIKHKQ
jgi:hypothetical protein